ncbi:Alpha/Beta hydrolase protein [Lactifluus volemus]|nr:Alpha/Beta hydrolase protein [Lactifluus volemus]
MANDSEKPFSDFYPLPSKPSLVNGAIPLLFVHGWPGSFIEVTKVLPLLTGSSPEHPSFHVVAPSLPGFAWSQGVLKKGFHGKHYAELTLITASLYGPKNVKASHTNMPMDLIFYVPSSDPIKFRQNALGYLKYLFTPYTSREIQGITATQNVFKIGTGYFAEQSTKPQMLGQLIAGTDSYPWSDDEVLTWVSIYWFSCAGPAASVRIYYELTKSHEAIMLPKSTVKIGISFFPKELSRFPRALLGAKAKVVFESEHDTGGHFAAYEEPEALVDDLRKMFGKSGPAASVVPGCPGY